MQILIGTQNQHKLTEYLAMLAKTPHQPCILKELEKIPPDPPETGKTFTENATLKATYYRQYTHLTTIADDSGLSVDALDGQPGVHSKRYAATDKKRNQKLIQTLIGIPPERRTARFTTVIAIALQDSSDIISCRGVLEGRIALKPTGSNGFGYDSVFYVPTLQKTLAQLSLKQKNALSHRAKALNQAKKILNKIEYQN